MAGVTTLTVTCKHRGHWLSGSNGVAQNILAWRVTRGHTGRAVARRHPTVGSHAYVGANAAQSGDLER